MICLIIYILICCNSTNYYNVDVSGVKLDALGKRGNYIDSIDNRINGRTNNNYKEREEEIAYERLEGNNLWKEEVKDMDAGIQELVTAFTSAIAGVYCLVKTIINIVKKIKK